MPQKTAVIAGAGPAGLTAAYELATRTNIKPIVFEATSAIGGISQTVNYKGNRIDIGGHRFFSKSERVMKWWFGFMPPEDADALNPPDINLVMLLRNRLSRIYYKRRFFPYPIGITLTVAWRMGLWNTFLIGLSYLKARIYPVKDETFLDAFFINRFGRRLYQTFFRNYTEKVWGVPCQQIRADWGAQRIKGLSLKRALLHAVKDLFSSHFLRSQQTRETSLITQFYYPKLGPGQLWETVADQVRHFGGEVNLKHRISGISLCDNRVVHANIENIQTNNSRQVYCDYFFSTVPIKNLISIITPHPPTLVTEVADGLQYRDFITVGILLTQLHVKEKGRYLEKIPDNWIYVQEDDVRLGRIQIFNNWSPCLVADFTNTIWIGLEYFVNEGGDLWTMADKDMISLGVSELERIGFASQSDILDACVIRMPKAYPAYFGSYNQLHVIKKYINQIDNLFLIGRNGQHRYNNQDHSMLTAMTAVDNILEGVTDKTNIWEINCEEEYLEKKTG